MRCCKCTLTEKISTFGFDFVETCAKECDTEWCLQRDISQNAVVRPRYHSSVMVINGLIDKPKFWLGLFIFHQTETCPSGKDAIVALFHDCAQIKDAAVAAEATESFTP